MSIYSQVNKPVLRRPVETGQYTSGDYTQTLDDHGVLASVGSVGDAYDNALAESFVDSFKTELIADRVWRSRSQLELAVVEYVGWFNNARPHESLGRRPAHRVRTAPPRPARRRLVPLALRARSTRRRHPRRRSNYAHPREHKTQLKRSPSNPVRLIH